MGSRHGAAAALWRPGGEVEWLGRPSSFSIGLGCWLSFQDLLLRAGGARTSRLLQDEAGIDLVVAIDAPLGSPRGFVRFLSGEEPAEILCPDREIESPLAYRETDRHVYGVFGKKPLSAAFDKLGNNATVAMAHVRRWQENHGFSVPPLTGPSGGGKTLIEVYPGLAKEGQRASAGVLEPLRDLLLPEVSPGSDAYDAALCALHALAYGASERHPLLPALVGPDSEAEGYEEEGWIFYFDPARLDGS